MLYHVICAFEEWKWLTRNSSKHFNFQVLLCFCPSPWLKVLQCRICLDIDWPGHPGRTDIESSLSSHASKDMIKKHCNHKRLDVFIRYACDHPLLVKWGVDSQHQAFCRASQFLLVRYSAWSNSMAWRAWKAKKQIPVARTSQKAVRLSKVNSSLTCY